MEPPLDPPLTSYTSPFRTFNLLGVRHMIRMRIPSINGLEIWQVCEIEVLCISPYEVTPHALVCCFLCSSIV